MTARPEWTRTQRVLNDVLAERERQIVKWGGSEADGVENPSQSNYVRLRVLAEEFGEAAEALGRPEDGNGKRHLRDELVQVAAVAVAWIEGLDHAAELSDDEDALQRAIDRADDWITRNEP